MEKKRRRSALQQLVEDNQSNIVENPRRFIESPEIQNLKNQIKALKKALKLAEEPASDDEEDDPDFEENHDPMALEFLQSITLNSGYFKIVSPKTLR